MREKGIAQTCPLCRNPLPPGPEKLFDLANRLWQKVMPGYLRDWPPLEPSKQKDMDGAIVMLREAMDQVCVSHERKIQKEQQRI